MINQKLVLEELSRRDYGEYVEYVHNGRYKHGRFTRYLTREIQDFVFTDYGHAYDILILTVPPQHGKSTTITETLPSYYLGKNPYGRVIEISYNDQFATKFIRRNKEKIAEYCKDIFGIEIGVPNTANEFLLTNKIGGMISRGVGSGIAGNDCNLLLIDDPVKNMAEADSETMRDNLWDEWNHVYKARLAPNAKVIIITTRWHMDDIVGRILQTERNVKYINFPVECLEEFDILGRKKGDALFPELGKDNAWLEDFKRAYQTEQGSRAWTTSFLGQPTNVDGNIFKRKWFNKYTGHVQTAYKAISIDASFKGDKDNDFVSIQVWGKIDQKYYLLDRYKARMGFVDTISVTNRIIARHMDYNVIYVEDKANGSAIVDVMHRRYQGVIPVNPEGGKVARAYAVQPLFESGCVFIRQDLDKDFEDEMCNFPEGVNDDDVDACTQALNRLREIIAKLSYVDPDKWDEEDQLNDVLGYR